MFIRDGTPIGFRMMSIDVPSGRYGMSSIGRMREITPLLPCRPAILSPSEILRFWAIMTRTISLTPAGSSCSDWSWRLYCLTSMTLPWTPCGTRSEVSFTSRAFSPKIARRSRSSADSSVSPRGVTLPTRMSFGRTSAPMRMIPFSSRSERLSSPTFGMSRVISSGPSLVSRASVSYFSMWIEVNTSSRTSRSLIRIASSKLPPSQGMNATSTFWPRASSPWSVLDESAMICPTSTVSPTATLGRWLMQVSWFERTNFCRRYSCSSPSASSTMNALRRDGLHDTADRATTTCPESRAA